MRFIRGDVVPHVVSQKGDHGASYRHCEAAQSWSRPKIKLSEIFDVVRFSTFSTVSTQSGRSEEGARGLDSCPFNHARNHW
jgi:hypothetical protein